MSTWFAQNSSVNIDSVNQWNSAANGSGSWLTWPPASGDNLVANGKTAIALNVDFNIGTGILTTGTTLGGTAGGNFTLSTARTITAGVLAGTSECVTKTGTNNFTWNGDITGGTSSGIAGMSITGTSTFTYNGNATAGSSTNCHGINVSSGTLNHTGNATGGSSTGAGVRHSGGGVNYTITGNCIGSANGAGVNTTGGTFAVVGNVVAGSGVNGVGVSNGQAAVFTLTGNIIHNTNTSAIFGPCQWNPGPGNYVEYPRSGGTRDYFMPRFLQGMNGGMRG